MQNEQFLTQDDFFTDCNIPAGNWWKKKRINDRIKGILVDSREEQGEGNFSDQIIYVIDTDYQWTDSTGRPQSGYVISDGQVGEQGIWQCGFDLRKTLIHSRLRNVKPGTVVGFWYQEDIAPKVKGYDPAKSIVPLVGEFLPGYLDKIDTHQIERDFGQAPMPQAPMPQAPMPQAPMPQAPMPQAPMPQAPMPQAPMPQAPMPQAPMQNAPVQQTMASGYTRDQISRGDDIRIEDIPF
jgi:hypothetical protein